MGCQATGIEIMPIGVLVGRSLVAAANDLDPQDIEREGNALVQATASNTPVDREFAFPHVRITEKAFSSASELEIARARAFLSTVVRPGHARLAKSCMRVGP